MLITLRNINRFSEDSVQNLSYFPILYYVHDVVVKSFAISSSGEFLSTNGDRKQKAEARRFLRTWNDKQIWMTQSCMIVDLTHGSGRVRKVRNMRGSGWVGSRWSRDSNLETRN